VPKKTRTEAISIIETPTVADAAGDDLRVQAVLRMAKVTHGTIFRSMGNLALGHQAVLNGMFGRLIEAAEGKADVIRRGNDKWAALKEKSEEILARLPMPAGPAAIPAGYYTGPDLHALLQFRLESSSTEFVSNFKGVAAQRAKLEALRSVPVMAVAVNDPLGVVICESGDECYTLRDTAALYERVKGIEALKVGVPISAAGSTPAAVTPASTAPCFP
jgi:hypothetical protein